MSEPQKDSSMDTERRAPGRTLEAFVCPHCRAFTQQSWFKVYARPDDDPRTLASPQALREISTEQERELDGSGALFNRIADIVEIGGPGIIDEWQGNSSMPVINAAISKCFVCKREAVWVGEEMIYPPAMGVAPEPNADLPLSVRADYLEAAAVLPRSPRACCALLRLCIQKLCSHVLNRSSDINQMIGDLVKSGMPPRIQKALDVVRVIGNEAVHPGSLDLRDDHQTASGLFMLVNVISEALISQPKHIEQLYAGLPESKLKAIEQRDRP